jgi:hypothetical protein
MHNFQRFAVNLDLPDEALCGLFYSCARVTPVPGLFYSCAHVPAVRMFLHGRTFKVSEDVESPLRLFTSQYLAQCFNCYEEKNDPASHVGDETMKLPVLLFLRQVAGSSAKVSL